VREDFDGIKARVPAAGPNTSTRSSGQASPTRTCRRAIWSFRTKAPLRLPGGDPDERGSVRSPSTAAPLGIACAVLHSSEKTCENTTVPVLKKKILIKINKLQTCWTK
jgi:hypothetical protein